VTTTAIQCERIDRPSRERVVFAIDL